MSTRPRAACSLIYHDVVVAGEERASGFDSPDADFYKLPVEAFEGHLDAVFRAHPAPPSAVADLSLFHGELLFLTFDDGGVAAIDRTADLLEARGWRGVFFVTTGRIGTRGFLAPPQIAELARRGHAIGSHSDSHPSRMSHLSETALEREWRVSRGRLEDVIGSEVTLASVPGGYYSDRVASTAERAGIRALWNSEPTVRVRRLGNCLVLGRFGMQRIHRPSHVAALVGGRPGARERQALVWAGKKLAKRLGGTAILAAREKLFAWQRRGSAR